MEQVEGGDLIVNRGDESRPKKSDTEGRDFNSVEGYEAALKLAQVCEVNITSVLTPELSMVNRRTSTNLSRTILRLRPSQRPLQYNRQLHILMFIFECSLSSQLTPTFPLHPRERRSLQLNNFSFLFTSLTPSIS
jgi:hypothetical protein